MFIILFVFVFALFILLLRFSITYFGKESLLKKKNQRFKRDVDGDRGDRGKKLKRR